MVLNNDTAIVLLNCFLQLVSTRVKKMLGKGILLVYSSLFFQQDLSCLIIAFSN